jgi:DNA polymerase-1
VHEDIFPQFKHVWCEDSEFQTEPAGCRPRLVSYVARNLRTGQTIRVFGKFPKKPPFPVGADTLLVSYYSSAEHGFRIAVDWPIPENTLDMFIVFRSLTNGLPLPHGAGLVGAMAYVGLDYPADKKAMIPVINSPDYAAHEAEIVHYNEVDVDALERFLLKIYPKIDQGPALFHSAYTPVPAWMEWWGLPIDMPNLGRLRRHWSDIQDGLISRINRNYGIYVERSFNEANFEKYLEIQGIPWPRLDSGRLALDDRVFREIGKAYPQTIGPLRELRHALSQLRLSDLSVGDDWRNRTLSSYFRARTSRSQPSNSRSIFGTSVWLRGLIKPGPDTGLIVADYEQQEFGAAAALPGQDGDPAMKRAYESGDCYLGFAVEAEALTRQVAERYVGRRLRKLDLDEEDKRVKPIRDMYKIVVLSLQYGRGEYALARTLDRQPIQARVLIEKSHEAFKDFWAWSDARVRYAVLERHISTVFGWPLHLPPDTVEVDKNDHNRVKVKAYNTRSLANFSMQANAAEMTRLAAYLAVERGIKLLMTVHDSLVAEAPLGSLEAVGAQVKACMVEASRIVLNGFPLRVDVKEIRYPHRYMDDRGERMWATVMELLDEIEGGGVKVVKAG